MGSMDTFCTAMDYAKAGDLPMLLACTDGRENDDVLSARERALLFATCRLAISGNANLVSVK